MYNQHLKVHGEGLAKAQILPKNSEAVGNGGFQRAGSMMGAAEIIVQAASLVNLGAGKSLSVFVDYSEDMQSVSPSPCSFKLSAGVGAKSWELGETMARIPLASDAGRYVRLRISTDDAAASGTFDASFDYLPR